MRLANTVAVVTGAAGHIGSAITARLLDEGATVVASDLRFAQADDTARVTRVPLDLRDHGAGRHLIDTAVQEHGGVDVLVANAGKATDADLDGDDDLWRDDIDVNLTANVGLFGAAVRAMRARGGGAIVAISSVNAHADFGNPAYSAAKAGLEALVRSVAARHGRDGIRANALVLGTVATPAWRERVERDPEVFEKLRACFPLGRVGRPDDVAGVVAFLASADAAWMTGSSVVLDGGLLVANPSFTSTVFGAS
ncbi:SDR family NAD(P)-dependent oxidoreductase [Jiangella rhizosphaerae]|uniref:SDR family oxidoreductase n=1 Tax=Jiangella rhizosphaerae TaxID=2293569 RepID=A0A418KM30_9ACTN|nr:SDR family oxidoreductase [Jiangella rhizosphaerae]RIQ18999.1 SDR family oxidoreductase [Jiangella rhizosphaerae]